MARARPVTLASRSRSAMRVPPGGDRRSVRVGLLGVRWLVGGRSAASGPARPSGGGRSTERPAGSLEGVSSGRGAGGLALGALGGLDHLGAGDAAAIRAFAGARVGAPHLPDADPVGLERGGELL